MKKQVQTDKAPKAIGPYSQGIVANGFVFCSGQIPIDPATGELTTGTIEDQTRQVLKNVVGRPRSRRLVARRRRQDDRLPPGHERLRQDERRLRRVLQGPQPGPGRGPGGPAAARRQGGDRGHRPGQVIAPSASGRFGELSLPMGKFEDAGSSLDSAPKQLARLALSLAQTRFVGFQGNSPRRAVAPAELFQIGLDTPPHRLEPASVASESGPIAGVHVK